MTVIQIKTHRWGWKASESPGVEPVFSKKDYAIDYAQNRACFRSGEIHVLDSSGKLGRTIAFSEAHRMIALPKCRLVGHNFSMIQFCWALAPGKQADSTE